MRTLSFTRKKPSSETLGPEIVAQALAGADVEGRVKATLTGDPGTKPGDNAAPKDVQAAAEPSSQSHLLVTTPPVPSSANSAATSKVCISSSSPMNRLRRMMRSQSDGGIVISGLSLVPIVTPPPPEIALEPGAVATASEQTGERNKHPCMIPSLEVNNLNYSSDSRATSTPGSTISGPQAPDGDEDSEANGNSSAAIATAAACDVFLNASIQLLHSQSDARQRVRQLWLTIQRLRYESQLSDTGVELLHTELLAVMKSFNMEKLEGARHLKTGYLTLVQAPNTLSSRPPLMAKSLFGSVTTITRPVLGQRMWCALSEEYGKFEMTPVCDERESGHTSSPPSAIGGISSSSPLAGLSNKLKLPTSLSSLLADAFQQAMPLPPSGNPEPARVIKLHGCQVRKIPAIAVKTAETGLFYSLNDTTAPITNGAADPHKVRHQIQILVPNSRSNAEQANPSSGSPRMSYSAYAFEVAESDGGEQECEAWATALDRVCMFHLYMLERSIRDVRSVEQYRHVLSSHLPLCISLSWLRNRIDRYDHHLHGNSNGQQQMAFQHQQQQRRSSKNLSMVQIIKDLERDKVLVDQKLITTTRTTNNTNSNRDGNRSEQGNISEVVKYVVMKVMDFVRKAEQRAKNERTTTIHSHAPALNSGGLQTYAEPSAKESTTSPTNRFTKYSEAKALAFVERVLRGSSRTQSGGDIYDAISFFCQHSRVSICPVSQDACPVQMNIVSVDTSELFQVEIQVCMRFKVIEMAPMMTTTTSSPALSTPSPLSPVSATPLEPSALADNSTFSSANDLFFENTEHSIADHLTLEGPKEWAVLEGTLSRQFTLGQLSEPGAVTINFIPQESSNSSS